ncbi:MAG: Tripartite tricarboxylate transporter TctB family, partial [Mycobacterium sp.]|nr:Tripartite tricarboxylate transporter TctB family [Mycobacterium sp.]
MSRHTEERHSEDRHPEKGRTAGILGAVVQATEQAEETVAAEATTHWTPRAFRLVNVFSAVAVTALGAATTFSSRNYPLWVGGLPGPGLFPGVVGASILVLGLIYLVEAVRNPHQPHLETEPPPDRSALIRSALSVAVLAASAFALVPIGYPIVAAAGVAALIRLAGGRWITAVVTGILFSVITFLLVTTTLGIQLPLGVLRPY